MGIMPTNSLMPNFSISYFIPGNNFVYQAGTSSFVSRNVAYEASFGTNGRSLMFYNFFSGLVLNFSSSPATPTGLHFESGKFYFNRMLLGTSPDPSTEIVEVTNFNITPISFPESSTIGVLLLPGIAFLLRRKKKNLVGLMDNS
jgi:hypothetical protein